MHFFKTTNLYRVLVALHTIAIKCRFIFTGRFKSTRIPVARSKKEERKAKVNHRSRHSKLIKNITNIRL